MNMKKIGTYTAIAIVAAALVFGIRALRINQIEARLENVELVNGLLPEKVRYEGENYLIPPSGVFDTGNTNEDIPSIDEPKMISIASADSVLADEVDGIVVEKDGEVQFYSLQILRWHEVVNAEIGGDAIAVTHCTLCHSSNVFERVYDGEEINLSISGLVYNNMSLLHDDSTNALWLQGRGISVVGGKLGETLPTYRHNVMTWAEYKDAHPNGLALSANTGFDYDYGINPYTNYDDSNTIYFPLTETPGSLVLKWVVDGFAIDGQAVAFARDVMRGFGVVSFDFADQTYIGLFDFEALQTNVFLLENDEMTFTYDFETQELRDEQTNSLWTATGLAIDGELAGTQLESLQTHETFWFCWYSMYPDTSIAMIDLGLDDNTEPETIE
jgi:hypothetical protein